MHLLREWTDVLFTSTATFNIHVSHKNGSALNFKTSANLR